MSTENTKPNANTIAAAAIMKPQLKVEGGNLIVPESLLTEYLGDDKKVETIIAAQKDVVGFTQALALAGGEVSIEHMAENKDITQVSFKTVVGLEQLDASYRREHSISAGPGNGRKNVHGHMTLSTKIRGEGNEFRRISKSLMDKGAAALASD